MNISLRSFVLAAFAAGAAALSFGAAKDVDVLCIYYPEWHVYPEGEAIFGKGRTEWDYVDTAIPRFEGHEQPVRLRDGHPDDANPADVAKEIDYAADAGIDCFLYDWYWADGHPIQHEALERGFMKAPNRARMKFALMWANHDRSDAFRPALGKAGAKWWWRLKWTGEEFLEVIDYSIAHYFRAPEYYRTKDGRLFFSVYSAKRLVDECGGPAKFRPFLDEARRRVKAAGLPPIHFSAMVRGPWEAAAVAAAGYDSTSSYNMTPYNFDENKVANVPTEGRQVFTHEEYARLHIPFNENIRTNSPLPHIPVAVRGWDPSARCRLDEPFPWKALSYPYLGIITDMKPELFGKCVADMRALAANDPRKPGMMLVNAWNEYTEGSYLMPDEKNGDAYLKALKAALRNERPGKADGACWIAYPGDHAIEQGNRLMARRNNHGRAEPSPWAAHAAWPTVVFEAEADFPEEETVRIAAQGVYYMRARGHTGEEDGTWVFPKGKYAFSVRVFNPGGVPALFIRGRHLKTDATWKVNAWNEEHLPVEAFAACDTPERRPCDFRLSRERREPKSVADLGGGHTLVDFGEETYGFLKLSGLKGKGRMVAIFGEWEDESRDPDLANAENYARFDVDASKAREIELPPRGFRYVHLYALKGDPAFGGVSLDYEYLPLETKGAFRCSDEKLNRIWDVAVRTLHLTAREAFLDGIKRDHWIWSGDARQSFLMNYYSFADGDICRRTLWALRGHDPYAMHMNWIMDYTFYWFLSVEEYYLFTGDRTFLEQIYPRMKSAMAFVIGRLDANGFIVNRGDWVFVDWAPKKMNNGSKESPGAVSFEQMLFVKALEATANVAKALGRDDEAEPYARRAAETKAKIMPKFWDEGRGAIYHYLEPDGKTLDKTDRFEALTRYPNMFGLAWGYFTPEQAKRVVEGVIFNDAVMKIQTPYMQFYEMEALLKLGRHADVLKGMRSYWGGMLDLGATSFWELYNPEEKGAAHMAMYNRPYGRSACHAWGASPVYLLGRYYLGVEPTAPGFAKYEVRPNRGGLEWMEGTVPTPYGAIRVKVDADGVRVSSDGGEGTLVLPDGRRLSIPAGGDGIFARWRIGDAEKTCAW